MPLRVQSIFQDPGQILPQTHRHTRNCAHATVLMLKHRCSNNKILARFSLFTQIFIIQGAVYFFIVPGYIARTNDKPYSVISTENETVKEAWIMRSRSMLYYTYKLSFSDFASHGSLFPPSAINKLAVLLAKLLVSATFPQRKTRAIHDHVHHLHARTITRVSPFNIFRQNFHSCMHTTSLSEFLRRVASRFCCANFQLHRDIVGKTYYYTNARIVCTFASKATLNYNGSP